MVYRPAKKNNKIPPKQQNPLPKERYPKKERSQKVLPIPHALQTNPSLAITRRTPQIAHHSRATNTTHLPVIPPGTPGEFNAPIAILAAEHHARHRHGCRAVRSRTRKQRPKHPRSGGCRSHCLARSRGGRRGRRLCSRIQLCEGVLVHQFLVWSRPRAF